MIYETKHNDTELKYDYEGNRVSIIRNGKFWGSPQGERYVVALLEDIEKYRKEIEGLKKERDMWKKEAKSWKLDG